MDVSSTLLIILGGIGAFYLAAVEIIDWAARYDYVREKWPKLIKWAEHKYWRVAILLLTFGLLGRAVYDLETPKNTGATIESPKKEEPQKPTEAPKLPEKHNEEPSPRPIPKTKSAKPPTIVKSSPVNPPSAPTQSAPYGINIGGDNNGTATVNNYGIHKPLLLSDDRQVFVASALAEFQGEKVEVEVEGATEETDAFAKALMASFSLTKINAHRTDVGVLVGPCLRRPGVSFMVGINRVSMANTIWNALIKADAVEATKGYGCSRSGEPDELVVIIRPVG